MRWGAARLIACLAAMLLVPPAAAQAAYPGTNGKLAFVRDGHIWTMNADGTGAAQLTTGTADAVGPRVVSRRDADRVRAEADLKTTATGAAPPPSDQRRRDAEGPFPVFDSRSSPARSTPRPGRRTVAGLHTS